MYTGMHCHDEGKHPFHISAHFLVMCYSRVLSVDIEVLRPGKLSNSGICGMCHAGCQSYKRLLC